MIIADTCALARFWHSSTPPMTTEHILAPPMWCHQLWLLSSHVRDILALISRQRGRQRRWSSIFIWIAADAFSCSAPVGWETVFAFMCTRMRNVMIIPVIFLHPAWLSRSFSWWRSNVRLSFTKRRRTSISQFQTKTKWNVNTFHNWWGLCVSMGKKPKRTRRIELDFKIQNGWKLGEITNDWNGIGEMDRTFRDVDMQHEKQCRKASLHFECFTKWFHIHPASDLRHHFHKFGKYSKFFFYVSVIKNTPICTVVLYLSDIPNASMSTTETHI